MDRIRFQVEKPQAGSAARIAEQEGRTLGLGSHGLGSLAGSAARAAEQAKRAEASTGFQGTRTVSMRATGGKVFQPPARPEHVQAATASATATAPPMPSAADTVLPHDLQVSATIPAEGSSQSGLLQTAVSRAYSLVRSFFPGRTGTP